MYKEQSVESILKLTPKEALESIIQDEISVTGITYGVDSFRFKINNVDYNFKLLEYGEISVRIDIKAPYHPSRFFKSHNSNSDILRYIKKHHKINNNLSKIKDLILDDLKKEYKNISVEAILTNLHPYDNLGVFSINSIDYSNEQTHLTFQQDPLVKIDRNFLQ